MLVRWDTNAVAHLILEDLSLQDLGYATPWGGEKLKNWREQISTSKLNIKVVHRWFIGGSSQCISDHSRESQQKPKPGPGPALRKFVEEIGAGVPTSEVK
jgi:hypothetical protein